MSDNKGKYFEVTTSTIVRANNMRDAVAALKSKKVPATILYNDSDVVRISAAEAREVASLNSK